MNKSKIIFLFIALLSFDQNLLAQGGTVEQEGAKLLAIENANIEELYEQLSLAQKTENSTKIFHYLSEVSIYYNTIGQWERSVELIPQIQEIAFEIRTDSIIKDAYNTTAIALRGKAVNLFKTDKISIDEFLALADSVIYLYERVIELAKPTELKSLMFAYQGIGQMYLKTFPLRNQDIKKAETNFIKALEISKTFDNSDYEFNLNYLYARSLLEQGFFDESLKIFDELKGNIDSGKITNNSLSLFYDGYLTAQLLQIDRPDLLELHDKGLDAMRTKWRVSRLEAVAGMDRQYETTKTKNELAQQEEINQLQQAQIDQRNLILVIIALLLFGSVGGGVFFFRLNRKNQQLAENNALLVKEQNHRVKNNLQMISSLLSLQANRTEGESKEHILDGSRRVQAIGLLHRKLYDDLNGLKEVNLKSYIEELVEDILYATSQPNIPVQLKLEDVSIPVEKAIHLALILNELITNSIKHVFSKENLNGECIDISLSLHHKSYQLKYKDHGGNFDLHEFEHSDSLGHQIIHSQSEYVGTKYSITNDHGFCYQLIFETQ